MKWKRLGRTRDCPEGIARYLIKEDAVYIWFAGSHKKEWLDNFRTKTIRHNGKRYNARDFYQAHAVATALIKQDVRIYDYAHVVLLGLSRGGAVACVFNDVRHPKSGFAFTVHLWAPKRYGIAVTRYTAHMWRGDIVPFLPLRYTGYELVKHGSRRWPWKAHQKAARAAAKWRHEITT